MRTFVKAVKVDEKQRKLSLLNKSKTRLSGSIRSVLGSNQIVRRIPRGPAATRRGAHVFRRGRIVGMKYLTPDVEITPSSKPFILMQLALPKSR
jgi:hypothetical protein